VRGRCSTCYEFLYCIEEHTGYDRLEWNVICARLLAIFLSAFLKEDAVFECHQTMRIGCVSPEGLYSPEPGKKVAG
jgi:hypothetical protein